MANNEVAYVGAMPESKLEGILYVPVLDIEYVRISDIPVLTGNIVIMSKRGVNSLKMSGIRIENANAICIGNKTAESLLENYGISSIYPDNMNSRGLLELIIAKGWKSLELIGSDHTSQWFLDGLKKKNILVNYVKAYRIIPSKYTASMDELSKVKSILFGSSLSFKYFIDKYGTRALGDKKLFAIGEKSAETMRQYGYPSRNVEEHPDINAILEKIESET
ncbi:MAG: uroporphyrinogen-III synthase [Thermoplasmatales archaeon]|nr:uroporphyrinogen-III synthase [Thermoplasmatales archaeon]MCW6171030.1 uroporphyrinogen-III synthase [Thermoplasmatales archaeon]